MCVKNSWEIRKVNNNTKPLLKNTPLNRIIWKAILSNCHFLQKKYHANFIIIYSFQSLKFPVMLFKTSRKDIHITEIMINYYQVPKSNLVRENPTGETPYKRDGGCLSYLGVKKVVLVPLTKFGFKNATVGNFVALLRVLSHKKSDRRLCIVSHNLVPLRGKKSTSHTHKTGSLCVLGVLFKISNKHPPVSLKWEYTLKGVPCKVDLLEVLDKDKTLSLTNS